jgi:hypothetical protein
VRLVADDDRVGVRDAPGVAHEPLIGLDGDRAELPGARAVAVEQRRRDAVGVAAVAQLAVELVDEIAAVGEDEDATGARGLDEAHRGDGLAGPRRVLEPEALVGVGVLGAVGDVLVEVVARVLLVGLGVGLLVFLVGQVLVVEVVVVVGDVLLVVGLVVDRENRDGGRRRDVAVALDVGQQRRQRARQRVDLVRVQRRPVGEVRLVLAEDAFEPEQQRVAPAPVRRGHGGPGLDLGQRRVERASAARAGRERLCRILAGVHETLAREALGTRDGVRVNDGCGRGGRQRGISHGPACCVDGGVAEWRRATRSSRAPPGLAASRYALGIAPRLE